VECGKISAHSRVCCNVQEGRARMAVSLDTAVLVVKLGKRFGHITYCVEAALKLMGNI
jgi:hypothetical protein